MSSTSSVNKYSLCSRTLPISPERFPFDITTTKKQSHFCNCFILSEKRDSSPRCAWAISRELYLHPQPLKGASGVASDESSCQTKKNSPFGLLLRLSGKRESVHLLPTLYIKQLPLPSTILPIRGTLGSFQCVVFESDFCHTNFRTAVAYDKFTNNF